MTLSIRDYEKVVFFTGAGMSAESGVPTYRGPGGIWKEYDYERYACQSAFDADPVAVWEFHNYRRALVAACEPNEGHRLIAQLERDLDHVTVITQNIDGLHQRAGTQAIIELHGSLWRVRCEVCNKKVQKREAPLVSTRCDCGRFWRPDIVWFGDSLVPTDVDDAIREMKQTELFISIGTSGAVYPAAELPLVAKQAGAMLVEVNPEPTPLSDVYDVVLRSSATEALTRLL